MYQFLINNRDELIERCAAKVAERGTDGGTPEQIASGVPLFLDQLIRTLYAEVGGKTGESSRISGTSGDPGSLSEMGTSAAVHGKVLLELGFTVEQVVHEYGDLCQAITDLAVERDAPFAIDEFRTLNRCLDNAIAGAVSEFADQRAEAVALRHAQEANQRLGFLVHELRNHLHTATMAFTALEAGKLAIGGSTSALVKRNLASMSSVLVAAIEEVRDEAAGALRTTFSVASFVGEVAAAASVHADARPCTLTVSPIDPSLVVIGHRAHLSAALANLLQNAFKFTKAGTEVRLTVSSSIGRVLIDVEDGCGGLPNGAAGRLFKPFAQAGTDRSGLGLGLSIARQSVQADAGSLSVRDLPGHGCVFTIDLPCHVE